MKSPVVKRSIVVAGHKTSVSLEEAFWNGMKEISGLRNMTLSELVGEIDGNRQQGNRDQASYHLSRIAAICGTGCEEYRSLAAALEKPPGTGLVY